MTRVRPNMPVVAVVVACLALVAALAGSAYAAITITGKDIKNDTVTGQDLKDRSLRGGDLLVRVASAQIDNDAVTGLNGNATALTVNITAPTKGYLAITASSDTFNFTASDTISCWISVDGTDAESSFRTSELNQIEGSNTEENCNTDVTEPVDKGKHVVRLRVSAERTSTVFDETTLRAIFIPFGPTGKFPTQFDITKGSGDHKVNNR
jgi:hypothetical protein